MLFGQKNFDARKVLQLSYENGNGVVPRSFFQRMLDDDRSGYEVFAERTQSRGIKNVLAENKPMKNNRLSFAVLALFIAGCLAVGFLGSLATSSSLQGWYPGLRKPPLNPPNWVFAPVWSVLYVLMAIAGWRLWSVSSASRFRLRALFILQLTFNALWSPIFFGLRNPFAGLVDIILLWGALLALVSTAWRQDRAAGFLLTPYFLWVSFATYLNLAIWFLNQ